MEIIDNENGRKWVIEKITDDRYLLTYFEYFKGLGWKSYDKGETCSKSYLEITFDVDLSQQQKILYI